MRHDGWGTALHDAPPGPWPAATEHATAPVARDPTRDPRDPSGDRAGGRGRGATSGVGPGRRRPPREGAASDHGRHLGRRGPRDSRDQGSRLGLTVTPRRDFREDGQATIARTTPGSAPEPDGPGETDTD